MGSIIALGVGLVLPRLAGSGPQPSTLLLVLGFGAMAFGSLAVMAPWLPGGILEVELSPIYNGVLTVIVGGAFGLSGRWLAASPFVRLAWFSLIVMGFQLLLFLFCLVRWAFRRGTSKAGSEGEAGG
jgi:hypothetical protein